MTPGVERVLVLRALGLGDLYAAVAALRGIRGRWETADIALAADPALGALMVAHALVDRVVPTDGLTTPPWDGPPPDVAVNLHGSGPQSHRALADLAPRQLVAFRCVSAGFIDGPEWDADEHEVDRWCRLVTSAGGQCSAADLRLRPPEPSPRSPLAGLPEAPVVVHPGAAAGSRRWPAHRWAAVARNLAEDGRPVVVTGGPAERDACRTVAGAHPEVTDLCGRLDVHSLAALIGGAELLLSGDTGVAHLATAYRTPSVLLFGPTPPSQWGPRIDSHLHRVLWRPAPHDPPGDPHGNTTDVRLDRIGVGDVLAEARSVSADEALRR
ncbi:MAG TPA: glycosyltransferase family 9 protein [Intrasporangium sp.]|uniref:glycosyltransferase family 9 protein n=1 Tax=Intrasporangium sp. TaxID=1925024 RepID=UPI002B46D90C|nr:glycosyltransferase family 9 protein [Intrasporangium sp.]HKX67394.1 glycosyltransferase family 9 protein [Intrasporangium sp.]